MSAPTAGKVYFAKCFLTDGRDMDAVKIGCATYPEHRIKSVAANQPFRVELVTHMPGDMFMEHFLHMWLRGDRISGEFFHLRGETHRILQHVMQHGTHPFPIRWTAPEGTFATLDVVQFMERHGISVDQVRTASGTRLRSYEAILKNERCGNRRFLAALAVTAVKRGVEIDWPNDFRAHKAEARAA